MNETFPATPISVETFAQRLVALDTLRHAIVELWDFAVRMEKHPTGWDAREVLRLEEIRQIVEAERPLLKASREIAEEYAKFVRFRSAMPKRSPREKSNSDEWSNSSGSAPRKAVPVAAPAASAKRCDEHKAIPAGVLYDGARQVIARSARRLRNTDEKVRRGSKARRRQRRNKKSARDKNKGH
jgi:hypothetical protein